MRFLIILIFILNSTVVFSQAPKQGGGFKMPSIGRVYGKVQDAKSKDALEFVSVAIYKGDSAIAGCFTKSNGEFNLENLPFGKLRMEVTFLGFKKFEQPIVINQQNVEQDLGNIKLLTDEKLLKTVEIQDEKSASQMTIDRKVYNVDKDLGGRGGTAVDIIKNIPSVTVDNDGNAQLRQNSAQIYIDGRPTTLTLNQIPSDQIDRVEIITNPSAKFEASATGGILNIVMKKNTKPGYNGVASAGIGTNDRYTAMLSLSVKQSPIGVSLSYNYNTGKNPVKGYTYRTNLSNGNVVNYFNQNNESVTGSTMQTGRLAFDYSINNRNSLTLAGNFNQMEFTTDDVQKFDIKNGADSLISYGERINNAVAKHMNYTGQLQYRKTFPKAGKELTADMNYNVTDGGNQSLFTTSNYDGNGTLYPFNPDKQSNKGTNLGNMYTFQSDFVNPLTDSSKIEMGIRSNYKITHQILDVSNYSYASDSYNANAAQTTDYLIHDMVNAVYINYANRWKTINYMGGLRFEQSYYKGDLQNKNFSFEYNYPSSLNTIKNALFPSVFFGKKIGKNEFQLNMSRKLSRPNFFQMMPFIMFSDKQNYRIGNPNLTPEFTNIAEFNFNRTIGRGSILSTLFNRYTERPITNYSYRYAADSSILINTFINGKHSNNLGIDNTIKYTLFKGFEVTWNINTFYTWIDAEYNSTTFNNKGFNYTSKLNLRYSLPLDITVQVNGNYESPKVIPQGMGMQQYFMDFSVNKDLFKRWSFTFNISDVFNTKRNGSHFETPDYIQDLSRRRESRYFKFTIIYRFGKADSSIFKRKSNKNQQGGQDGGGMDF